MYFGMSATLPERFSASLKESRGNKRQDIRSKGGLSEFWLFSLEQKISRKSNNIQIGKRSLQKGMGIFFLFFPVSAV